MGGTLLSGRRCNVSGRRFNPIATNVRQMCREWRYDRA
jgi:hypothetical protein